MTLASRHRGGHRCDRRTPDPEGDLRHGLVYYTVRVRLIEIGEAVKGIRPDLLAEMPEVPWSEIARMRAHLAHRYFDTDRHRSGRRRQRAEGLLEAVRTLLGLGDRDGSGT
jgi:hypothetical protein